MQATEQATERDRLLQSTEEEENQEVSRDSKPTSRSEIIGWCLYGWAAEPFIVCAVSTYVPLLLEQLARENGVKLIDKLTPCIAPLPDPLLPPSGGGAKEKCVVNVLGYFIDTSSLPLYTFSTSVFVQTLVVISMSGAADRGHYRKILLVVFGLLGGFLTSGYMFITTTHYYIACLLAIFANSCFGAVNVCGNAFLPVLVANDEEFLKTEQDQNNPEWQAHRNFTFGILSSKLSGIGAATGYLSALVVQILTMFIIVKTHSTTYSIQLAIGLVGVWWFIFQIPLVLLLDSRPGPPLNLGGAHLNSFQLGWKYINHGWLTLFHALKQASYLKDVIIFLIGWFIISDSIVTINSAAILFARTELSMSTTELAAIGLLTVISAIGGSSIIPRYIQPKFNLTPKAALMLIIVLASFIPLYGLLGFYFTQIGLKSPKEMYILAIWYGFALGGLATVSRSFFSLLIPRGKESIFFALFSVTDKGSSILGPIVVGLVTDKTHNIRYCFYFLFLLLIVSLPVFNLIDLERGSTEAQYLEHIDGDE